jgi:tRNA threonylcarbamoyladenosine modification (KEOPS) complex Cgi121 subunit
MMCLFKVNYHRMIETSPPPRHGMDEVQFPHFLWQSSKPAVGALLTQAFLKNRPNEHWVLVGEGIAQCHAQLWTAWHSAVRRQNRGTSLARSLDAEFLRYLSGTHHVSEAFKRAGVRNGDQKGCFLALPSPDGPMDALPSLDGEQHSTLSTQAALLAEALGVEIIDEELECNASGAQRLGLEMADFSTLTCEALIGHIVSAEFHS